MSFLYGAVVLFIEEEEDIDEEKEEVEEEEVPFYEAYAERGREGETRSEVLAVKELDGSDGITDLWKEGWMSMERIRSEKMRRGRRRMNPLQYPQLGHSICMMTNSGTMPVLGTGMTYVF